MVWSSQPLLFLFTPHHLSVGGSPSTLAANFPVPIGCTSLLHVDPHLLALRKLLATTRGRWAIAQRKPTTMRDGDGGCTTRRWQGVCVGSTRHGWRGHEKATGRAAGGRGNGKSRRRGIRMKLLLASTLTDHVSCPTLSYSPCCSGLTSCRLPPLQPCWRPLYLGICFLYAELPPTLLSFLFVISLMCADTSPLALGGEYS